MPDHTNNSDSLRIRRYRQTDREFVLSLTPRLIVWMAPWRDPAAMHAAMRRFTSFPREAIQSIYEAYERFKKGTVIA